MMNKSLLALASGLSFVVSAQVIVLEDGRLETQACAYGRGATAVSGAKAQAAAEFSAFIRGNKHLSITAGRNELHNDEQDISRLYEASRESLLQGLQQQALTIDTSSPRLEGNDTCITARLPLTSNTKSAEINWDDSVQDISVTVIGEGWPKQGRTALQNAEHDALKRAISQVAGVWLTQNHAQSSQTSLLTDNDAESTQMREIVGQQLSIHSEGLVKEWRTLNSAQINNGGIQLTLNVVVEKKPLIQQAKQLLSQIGNPYVKVNAAEPLKTVISTWLSEQGIEVSDNSSLMVEANSKLRLSGNNQRLYIRVKVKDQNNIYSSWMNDPSLIALPDDASVLHDLVEVHFSDETQLNGLYASLQKGFTRVVAQGGLVREIIIPNRLIKPREQLAAVFSTLAGVTGVDVHQRRGNTIIQLRYKGGTGELARAVHMALKAIAAKPLPQINITDNHTLSYL